MPYAASQERNRLNATLRERYDGMTHYKTTRRRQMRDQQTNTTEKTPPAAASSTTASL